MRATVEKHETKDEIPPITVDIVKGNEDLTIRISDLGGGIPRSTIYDLFAYHYSTAPEPDQQDGMAPLVRHLFLLCILYFISEYHQFCSINKCNACLLYTSPSPRDKRQSRMPSSA